MGYTTEFDGALELAPPATPEQRDYINAICNTRRMKRDVNKLMQKYKGKYGNPFAVGNTAEEIYGNEGQYFAKEDNNEGQTDDGTIIDFNNPPGQVDRANMTWREYWQERERRIKDGECQPGLWCDWIITEDGRFLEWNGAEKFYDYIAWLKYLIDRFFNVWGIELNGEINWQGENYQDRGTIEVKHNVVGKKKKKKIRKFTEFDPYGEEDWEE